MDASAFSCLGNEEVVGIALRSLISGLTAYVEQCTYQYYGYEQGNLKIQAHMESRKRGPGFSKPPDILDVLLFCLSFWHAFESTPLAPLKNNLYEIKDIRNRWAHQEAIGDSDTFRLLDSVERVLGVIQYSGRGSGEDVQDLQRVSSMKRNHILRMASRVSECG
ncbi:uncharacterized protein LOC126316924 [Schistocerca gregaria]|uniref:uncharacterized protein LOC126316924 n=1 Tax=Schistocerca gregaria TaxID=7010 RepID=UPI00211E2533|nr:uncharacterized protein LOC126316924 [Schistocerca gregaria]